MQHAHPSMFEIDDDKAYGRFILTHPAEITNNLRALAQQHQVVTLYLDEGHDFFLTSILTVDTGSGSFLIDLPDGNNNELSLRAKQKITLCALLDKVKIQIRPNGQALTTHEGRPALFIPRPERMLRLQRREYFRLETPHAPPLQCRLARQRGDGTTEVIQLPLTDISVGGLSLMAPAERGTSFAPGSFFRDCRLEIPDEGVIIANLCVRETHMQRSRAGQPYLKVGLEFVNLPGTRLSQIQRYITRIERERKARGSSLG